MTDRLSYLDAVSLGYVLGSMGKRVRWLRDPDSGVLEGVARHIVKSPDNPGFLTDEDDVRDGYVRISATFEHFIPVREAMTLVINQCYRVDEPTTR